MSKCKQCIHYNVCDKWWEYTSIIDFFQEEFSEFLDSVSDESGCERFEEGVVISDEEYEELLWMAEAYNRHEKDFGNMTR
jgi:hypothetical protein